MEDLHCGLLWPEELPIYYYVDVIWVTVAKTLASHQAKLFSIAQEEADECFRSRQNIFEACAGDGASVRL